MPFNLIIPQAKKKAGKLTISCSSRQGGAFRLMLSIPHAIWTINFGTAEKIDVALGAGADEGRMLLSVPAGGGGHFKPTFFKTNILLRLPELDCAPDFKMEPFDPEHRQTKDGLLITLPDWAWDKERQKAIRLARQQVKTERNGVEARLGK